jgi:hypothetical protein
MTEISARDEFQPWLSFCPRLKLPRAENFIPVDRGISTWVEKTASDFISVCCIFKCNHSLAEVK